MKWYFCECSIPRESLENACMGLFGIMVFFGVQKMNLAAAVLYNFKMNSLSFLFKRDPVKYLGRWNVDYCHQILHTKVRLANEDHCGTCYIVSERTKIVKKEYKTDAMRRYNEYINVAIRSRNIHTSALENDENDIEKQIKFYICMN